MSIEGIDLLRSFLQYAMFIEQSLDVEKSRVVSFSTFSGENSLAKTVRGRVVIFSANREADSSRILEQVVTSCIEFNICICCVYTTIHFRGKPLCELSCK